MTVLLLSACIAGNTGGVSTGDNPSQTPTAMAEMDHSGMQIDNANQPFDLLFIDSMIVHHQGAIEMATINLSFGESRGKVVDTQTLKALLAVSLENVRATDYRFCRTESCSVVYFSTGGEQTFTEIDLRERVHQKHPMNTVRPHTALDNLTPAAYKAEWLQQQRLPENR